MFFGIIYAQQAIEDIRNKDIVVTPRRDIARAKPVSKDASAYKDSSSSTCKVEVSADTKHNVAQK